MQREELSDPRNRQAAPRNEGQNEDQIWQRVVQTFKRLAGLLRVAAMAVIGKIRWS
jgi:hypothetical protein